LPVLQARTKFLIAWKMHVHQESRFRGFHLAMSHSKSPNRRVSHAHRRPIGVEERRK
jgi:hypothetical protein